TFFFRHMTELIKRGHVYIAQPPLYRIKKGKFEQYIKDDREFVNVMVKRASDGIVVRYGADAATLEGAALTRFMGHLNEYLGFFDKVNKRLRNEEVTSLLAKLELVKRTDFEGTANTPPPKLVKLHTKLQAIAKKYQFKSVDEPVHDEEHHTFSLCFHDAQGAERRIDWNLAASPEYRQMMSKYMLIKDPLEGPFLIESSTKGAVSEDAETEAGETTEAAASKPATKRAARTPQDPVE